MDDQELLNNKEQVVDNDDGLKEMQKALKAQADFENALDSGSLRMKDFAVLKEFFKYLKPYLGKFLFGLSLDIIITFFFVIMPKIYGELINYFNGESTIVQLVDGKLNYGVIAGFAAVYIFIAAIAVICMYYNGLILYVTGQYVVHDIRKDLFEHVESLSMAQINAMPAGKFVTRITNDCRGLSNFFTELIVMFFRDILNIIMILIISILLSWQLSLIFICFLPIIFFLSYIFRKYSKKYFRQQWRLRSDINGFLSENFSGIRTVKIFDKEKTMIKRFDEKNEELRHVYKKQMYIMSIYRPLIFLLQMVAVILVLYFGIVLLQNGAILTVGGVFKSGDLYTFYSYTNQFFGPVQDMAELINSVQSVLTSAERVSALMNVKPSVSDSMGAKKVEEFFPSNPKGEYVEYFESNYKEKSLFKPESLKDKEFVNRSVESRKKNFTRMKGDITFDHVWFAYVGKEWVLKDVSFHINAGETAAFVGSTGAGKSTIIGLIVRNMIPQKGHIYLDGIDINALKIEDIRRNVSQMLQEVFLFSGTIADNIDLFDENPNIDKLNNAIEMVGARKFIDSLDDGINSEVRERGVNFSIGQRQLISFARAIYADPSFMVLDEATANIDTETENIIQDSLKRMRTLGTMVIVAHRLSTIQDADHIYVIDHGVVVEDGNHDSLLKKHGLYYSMYRLQNLEKDLNHLN